MRVLVSGSHGLIGSELVARLRSSGHEPVRLVRGVQRDPAGPAEVRWDIDAGTIDPDALDGVGAVVNLAGVGIAAHRWSVDHKRRVRSSRIDGTRLLAGAVAAADPRPSVLVNASAIGYYGDRGDEELTEESGPGPGFLADLCRQWEAATGAEAAGVRVVHLRSGIVLSPKGGALAKQLPLFRLGLGGRLGSGRQWTSWISIDDEVGAILHALGAHDGGVRGPLNATAPHPVTNAEFTRVLARVLRRPAVARAPGAALSAVMGAEMAKEMLLASQRVLPTKLTSTGYRFHHSELEPALRDLLGR